MHSGVNKMHQTKHVNFNDLIKKSSVILITCISGIQTIFTVNN